jgi:hypothetical protein
MYFVLYTDICVYMMYVYIAAPARSTAASSHVRLRPRLRSLTVNRYPYLENPYPYLENPYPYLENPYPYLENPYPYLENPYPYPGNPYPYLENPYPYLPAAHFVRVPVSTPLNPPRVAIEHLVESPFEVPREGPFSTLVLCEYPYGTCFGTLLSQRNGDP